MPKVVKSSAREMILKVKEFCEAEQKNQGVSEKTITRITKEGITAARTSKKIVTPGKSRPHPKKFDLDGFDLCAIRQKIHSFYVVHKELPTLAKLRAALREDINFQGSITTLHRILNRIGFKYKRCQSRRKLLMERHDITAWRARYLEAFESITAAQCTHVEHLEEEYLKNDGLMDEEMDRIIISTASDTETESDSVSIHSSDSDVPMAADHNYSIKL
ncbi:unnamed protein product [Parnassius mnemosyne]|uniref:Winged helix-turn helix domain-containing protein n=1 Tax=Parnassius mnemosyne TaxID=213953 RepID=A0AAV1L3Y4_9NEOP